MVAEHERKSPLGRTRGRWDIKACFIEIIWERSGQHKFGLEQEEKATAVGTEINLQLTQNSGNFSTN